MSKRIKTIIVGGAVLVLLVAAVVVLLLLPKPGEDTPVSSTVIDDGIIEVFNEDSAGLTKMTVKNELDEYVIESLGESKWGIKAFDGLNQTADYETLVNGMSGMYANLVVAENVTDMALYGLDTPTLEITLEYSTGVTHTVTVGDMKPDISTAYTIVDGKNTVYQVAPTKFTQFMTNSLDFIDKAITPAMETDEAGNSIPPSISAVEIARPDLEKPILLEKYKAAEHSANYAPMGSLSMVSPVVAETNQNALTENIYTIFGLTAQSVAAINPDAAQLAEFGMADAATAASVVNVTYNETLKLKLITGNETPATDTAPACYYVMVEGTPIVYTLAKESALWMTIKPENLLSAIAVLAPILDLEGIDITVDGVSHKLAFEFGEDKTDTNNITATLDGKETDIDNAKKYLQLMYDTGVESLNTEAPMGDPVISYTYKYLDGKTDRVDLYVREDRKTIVSVNGNNAFVGRAGFIEKLRNETQNLLKGVLIKTDY